MSAALTSIHSDSVDAGDFGVLVHGGAGFVPEALVPAHIEGCRAAAREGARVLAAGGSALDAVQRAVEVLEANEHFNAGVGASLNAAGELELDASIMCGRELRAGAVCALPPFVSPIAIARRVLEDGAHVLMAGDAAARWAETQGFVRAAPADMITPGARDKLARVQASGESGMWAGGTVGAVARDAKGDVAAATSTGGTVNKRVGRVGDSPIVGAGTYADNALGACSCTGAGEAILRLTLARQALDRAATSSAVEGARRAIDELGRRLTAVGGLIVATPDGTLAFARNTRTMSWAWETARGPARAGA
ncbi:MAG: isoaspartyl peptidase/L-asparaginase [Myxococcales bacterium]|nr:isoaspartyl peptidase/L-asparaginase [Myxococcales bacterium]